MTKITILRRSQRAFKGWTGRYRREIDVLEFALTKIAERETAAEYDLPHGRDYERWHDALINVARLALEEHKHE